MDQDFWRVDATDWSRVTWLAQSSTRLGESYGCVAVWDVDGESDAPRLALDLGGERAGGLGDFDDEHTGVLGEGAEPVAAGNAGWRESCRLGSQVRRA